MQDDQAIPKNVSLYEEQWEVVEEVNEALRLRNRSAAMRKVVDLAAPHVKEMVKALKEGHIAVLPSYVSADADRGCEDEEKESDG